MRRFAKVLILSILLVAVTVHAYGAGDYVRGKVLTSAGQPASSVWVLLKQGDVEKGRSLTGDDGIYDIGNLAAGTYTIVVVSKKVELFRRQIQLPQNQSYDIHLP